MKTKTIISRAIISFIILSNLFLGSCSEDFWDGLGYIAGCWRCRLEDSKTGQVVDTRNPCNEDEKKELEASGWKCYLPEDNNDGY